MKTIFLCRHAQAVSKKKGIPDFERSPVQKGIKESTQVARRLVKKKIAPAVMISSPANRALETAHVMADVLEYPKQNIILRPEIYENPRNDLFLNIVRGLDDAAASVMLVGHDPSLSEFAGLLLPGLSVAMPKSGVLAVGFEVDAWRDIKESGGVLQYLDFPLRKNQKLQMEKAAFREIENKITQQVEMLLRDFDVVAPEKTKKLARTTGRELAARLVKASKKKNLIRWHFTNAGSKTDK